MVFIRYTFVASTCVIYFYLVHPGTETADLVDGNHTVIVEQPDRNVFIECRGLQGTVSWYKNRYVIFYWFENEQKLPTFLTWHLCVLIVEIKFDKKRMFALYQNDISWLHFTKLLSVLRTRLKNLYNFISESSKQD